MATAEFSRFAGILSAALSQHHLPGFEIAQLEFLHFMANRWGKSESSDRFYFLGLQNGAQESNRSHEIKRCLLLHAKMGSIKDRNGMDLTEAEDIKKSWREYTEELYKKDLHDPDNHDGVITHLETDILEREGGL